jgi:iron complex outermembrane receptor protein
VRPRAQRLTALGTFGLALCLSAQAQSRPPSAADTAAQALPEIEVRARSMPVLEPLAEDLGGFNVGSNDLPAGFTILGSDLLRAVGVSSWTQAIRLDSALSDFYNTTGYVQGLQVRGFVLDNLHNFRRDGLPISNHAPLALDNKERIDVLKGVAGLQAGSAAPGGLIDIVVKRPTGGAQGELQLASSRRGGLALTADWGGVLSESAAAGSGKRPSLAYRINLATEQLRPEQRRADGARQLLAAALDWRPLPGALLQAEFEHARSRQPSVPGLGLLDLDGDGVGETLPQRIDPRANLNDQPWSLPFDSRASVASLRWTQALADGWQLRLSHLRQRIATDDRIVFPDGCSSAAVYVYPGLCANGDVDFYDFRSEGERRRLGATELRLQGRLALGGTEHRLKLGWLGWRYDEDYQPFQAYNYIGTGSAFGSTALTPDDRRNDKNTWRRERNGEWFLQDTVVWSPRLIGFAGLRQVRTERSSARYDGTRALAYRQTLRLPFLAATYKPNPTIALYSAWTRGMESEAVPNRPSLFSNAGATLPALVSRQWELGARWQPHPRLLASAALFDIRKPFADDQALPDGRSERIAGARVARHRGLELSAAGRIDPRWSLQASFSWIDARTVVADLNPQWRGKRSPNVAPVSASVYGEYRLSPSTALGGTLRYQGRKAVGLDNLARLPATWQVDANLRYSLAGVPSRASWAAPTLRVQVENLFNRKQWQEAPTQYWGGTYLFPSPPRSLRVSVQWTW